MDAISGEIYLLLALIAAGCVLGLLIAVAACIRDETAVHDLRVEVNTMRNRYLREIIESENYSADPVAGLRMAGSEAPIEVGSD